MRYAINVPNFGDYADPATFLRLARQAEAADWDGLFVWDHVLVGEDPDPAVRARKLDEGLAILDGLWSGAPFAHAGMEFHLQRMRFEPVPLQRPRIPIWVGGYWPHREAYSEPPGGTAWSLPAG